MVNGLLLHRYVTANNKLQKPRFPETGAGHDLTNLKGPKSVSFWHLKNQNVIFIAAVS